MHRRISKCFVDPRKTLIRRLQVAKHSSPMFGFKQLPQEKEFVAGSWDATLNCQIQAIFECISFLLFLGLLQLMSLVQNLLCRFSRLLHFKKHGLQEGSNFQFFLLRGWCLGAFVLLRWTFSGWVSSTTACPLSAARSGCGTAAISIWGSIVTSHFHFAPINCTFLEHVI